MPPWRQYTTRCSEVDRAINAQRCMREWANLWRNLMINRDKRVPDQDHDNNTPIHTHSNSNDVNRARKCLRDELRSARPRVMCETSGECVA